MIFFCSSHQHSDMNTLLIKNIWYQEAVNDEFDKIFFTSIYKDKSTKNYVFTIYKKIKVDDKVVIIASDIIVNTLKQEWLKGTETVDKNIYILTNFKGDVVFTTFNIDLVIKDQYRFYNVIKEIEKRNTRIGLIKDKFSISPKYSLFYLYDKNNHFVSMVAVPLSAVNGSVNSLYMYIENIRKFTKSGKVDVGGDFQRILTEGYKWINIRLLYDESVQKDYAVLCFKERDVEKKRELEHRQSAYYFDR